ncbi:lysophospholipid acyltransferase family protein [Lichenicoccus sp.]|uniref:lysophospholipid acyltransferase family protein n=1 Tax=Lichenicoccus sp. TaxID=2781899 RepID=UPI003D0BF7F5
MTGSGSGYLGPMQAAPRRLGRRFSGSVRLVEAGPAQHDMLGHDKPGHDRIGVPPLADRAPHRLPPTRRLWRRLRVIRRGLVVLAWTLVAGVIQSVLLALPGRGKARFARIYWAVNCRLVGVSVRVIGVSASGLGATGHGRPVVYASNHSSWLDVPVLGGLLQACFVAKDDVGRWPLVGQVARLGRTIFVSRQRGTTGRERDDMRLRLAAGDDLLLFPEGTSSDGTGVLPFHSSFFASAKPTNGKMGDVGDIGDVPSCAPLVQPVSVVYDRLAGLPVGNARRAVFAWYGDMDLASHFWALAQWRSMRASVWLHPPLDPADFPTRKALSQATWEAVARGAAVLRQNRPVPIDDTNENRDLRISA